MKNKPEYSQRLYRGKGFSKMIKASNKSERAKERRTIKNYEFGVIDESDVELINEQNKRKVLSDWQ